MTPVPLREGVAIPTKQAVKAGHERGCVFVIVPERPPAVGGGARALSLG
jgi:hypothetical protein